MSKIKNILYLSIDGLLDPLGQSQILGYVFGGRAEGLRFHFLTFEKPSRLNRETILNTKTLLASRDYQWSYLIFQVRASLFFKIFGLLKFIFKAGIILNHGSFSHIHARSFIPVIAALILKALFPTVKVILDTRGSWILERAESLNAKHFFLPDLGAVSRCIQTLIYRRSDFVIFQTESAKSAFDLQIISKTSGSKSYLIRNSANFGVFKPLTPHQRELERVRLGIGRDDLCLGYVGSLGTWYLDKEIMSIYFRLKCFYPSGKYKFLLVSPDPPSHGSDSLRASIFNGDIDLIYISSRVADLPFIYNCIDYLVCFIRPTPSKRASSPTKFPEAFACGTPVLTNSGIGDFDFLFPQLNCGLVAADLTEESLNYVASQMKRLTYEERLELRSRCEPFFALDKACQQYSSLYES